MAEPSPAPETASGFWSAGRISFVLLAGILLLTLIWERPSELDRWRLTQALSACAHGDKEQAYRLVSAVIEREPTNPSYRVLRADWRLSDDDAEAALADLDAAVKERPADEQLRTKRGLIYQELDRYPEAVADWEEVVRLTKRRKDPLRIHDLNNLAYARAVGDINPQQGLIEINEAFKLMEGQAQASRAMEQDTRGFLHYRLGNFHEAKDDLDASAKAAEGELKKLEAYTPAQIKQSLISPADFDRLLKAREMLAVILYHRGLVLEKLDYREEAANDFQHVRELGFEPNEKLH